MPEDGLAIRKVADKSEGERVPMLIAPPNAIEHLEDGSAVVDHSLCERRLVNPDTPGYDHEPWPLLGIQIDNDKPPKKAILSTSYVAQARDEGWIEVRGEKIVHKPAGPAANPWANTHTFVQLDAIILKTVDGDVRYRVVHNPDKYDDETGEPTDNAGDPTTHVDWFYGLELDNG